MRGTIHLLVPDDALMLRGWTQPVQERERKVSQNTRAGLHLDPDDVRAAVDAALADGPLPVKALGEAMAQRFPDVPPNVLGHLARVDVPLVQLPPRGCWGQSGGVVYDRVDRWLGRPQAAPDPEAIVRRYLTAFGPATAADVTAWSAVTRLGPVLAGMEDLVRHTGPDGRTVYDVPGGEIVTGDVPAPPRLLGTYDNVWLSHAKRDRVTSPDKRSGWMGSNGGIASTVFVDGMLEGLWRLEEGRITIELFRDLTRRERADLDDEVARVEALLDRRSDTSTRKNTHLGTQELTPRREVRSSGGCGRAGRTTAATPAVEVRSTSAPSRTARTPAASNAASSSSAIPPSGPTTTTIEPVAGTDRSANASTASSWSTTARSAAASSATTSAVVASGATVGNHERRACLAASRAVADHFACDLVARSPRQTATDRDAAHGTIMSTPISVSISTASSPRSPLGSACTTVTDGCAGSTSSTDDTVTVKTRLPVDATSPSAVVPAPSVSTTCSPTRRRRTATAWCASSPVTSTVPPPVTPAREGTRWTGRLIRAG